MTALLVLFVVLYLLIRLVMLTLLVPRAGSRWRGARRRRAGEHAVTQALVALGAGEKADARREASRARALLGDTPHTLLLAAEAGRLAGRDDEAAAAFHALAARKDLSVPGFARVARQRDRATEMDRGGGAGATGRGSASRRRVAAPGARATRDPRRRLGGGVEPGGSR